MDHFALVAIILYMVLQLGLAIYSSRFINSETDYLIAGRQLGTLLITFSIFATWFGAETIIASSGAIAAEGMAGGRAEPFGYALCLLLFALLIAYRLRAHEYVTTSDFYLQRFGKIAEKVSVLLVIPTSLIWAAAQVVAFAHVLASVSQIDFDTALVAGTTIVVIYTTIGGFLGDVITDLVQGIFVIIGLLITAVFVVIKMGGISAVLSVITPERLDIFSSDSSIFGQLDEWTIAIVGSLISQEAISRILAAKSPKVARNSCYNAAAMYFFIGLIPAFIGLVGVSLIEMPENSDMFLPELARTILPPYIYIMFLGALISAILSTIDSTLLSVGALAGHNIIIPFMPGMEEKDKVGLQRTLVMAAGFVTYIIAAAGENIYALIEASSSFGSAGLLVCLIFGLWTRLGNIWAALSTMAAGAASSYIFQYNLEWDAGYIASIGVSVIVYILVSLFERGPPPQTVSAA